MRIDIYNNCNGKTTIINVPFSHKDFAENEDTFLEIYRKQLTDVLASAILAHRHDGLYFNISSTYDLSYKITTFLKAAGKKNHGYDRYYSLLKVAEDIKTTSKCIINPEIATIAFDNDKAKLNQYINSQYEWLNGILIQQLSKYKKGE